MPQIRSASRWIAAFCDWACSTRATRRASWVSRPTLTARTTSRPATTTVPAATMSPSVTSAGTDSPVIMLASTADCPNSTSPSAAIRSPAHDEPLSRRQSGDRDPCSARQRSSTPASRARPRPAPASRPRRRAAPWPDIARPASRDVVTDAATSK